MTENNSAYLLPPVNWIIPTFDYGYICSPNLNITISPIPEDDNSLGKLENKFKQLMDKIK